MVSKAKVKQAVEGSLTELLKFTTLVLALRVVDENFRCSTAAVLFEVAQGHPFGISSRDLQEQLGMNQGSVARALLRLGSLPSGSTEVGKPLGLISRETDPEEPRRYLYSLSAEGARVVHQLLAATAAVKPVKVV